jgi:hypothetical protein
MANTAHDHPRRNAGALRVYFLSGWLSPTGMTFEQFLLVAAAIKPADLPAIRKDCSLMAEGRYL